MAIDDNTSYALTGAQVKDLAAKIKAKADTTDLPSVMTGATTQVAGTSGLVPAPTTSDVDKYLKGDGTWATVSGGSQDAVTLYCYWGDSSYTFTPYYDAAKTQAVSYFDFVQLVRTKLVTLMWDDHDGFNYTQTIIATFVDSSDPTDPQNPPNSINFIAAQSGYPVGEGNLFEYTWNSEDIRFSSVGNPMIPKQNVWYAASSSSAATSSKTASIANGQGGFSLKEGVTVFVKFSNQNTSSGTLYLNVGGTGNKQVYVTGTYSDGSYLWNANDVVGFVYDGTYWRMLGGGKATTSSYGKVKLATSYTSSGSDTVPTSSHLYSVYSMLSGKQNQLTAGTGITIDQNNVISATGGSYTYSGSVDTINNSFTTTLSDGTTTQDVTLNAGTGITFSSSSSGPSIVGPTPANTSTDATQISGLTFTPGAAGTGYFYVLRVGKSSSMSGDVYSARLYKSNQSFNFTSQAEVEAAIWPNGQQIDVNPNNSGAMSGFFDSSFQSIEYVSGRSTAAEAIAAVYTAEATFGGTVTFDSKHVYVDAYVYVMGQGANTLTISATSNVVQTTGQSTTDVMSQKAVTDIIGNVETILQTLNSGTGAQ